MIRPNSNTFRSLLSAVKCSGFVTFGQSRVIEYSVDEVLDGPAERKDGLTDVEEFARTLPDDVHAEDAFGFAVEDELQAAGGIAADLTAGNLAIICHPDFIGDILRFGQLFFRLGR